MLSGEEADFVQYWESNRLRRKRGFRRLAAGLPLGAVLVMAIFINFFSGWYKRADMEIRSQAQSANPSLIYVLVAAALLIVVFIVLFSARHKWDMYEQRYRELLSKKEFS
jgi:hypothetical protein